MTKHNCAIKESPPQTVCEQLQQQILTNQQNLHYFSPKQLHDFFVEQRLKVRKHFGYFTQLLQELTGINYWELCAEQETKQWQHVASSVTHEIELFSDYCGRTRKFAVTDKEGTPIHSGVISTCNRKNRQYTGVWEAVAARKAVNIANMLRNMMGTAAIKLVLYTDYIDLVRASEPYPRYCPHPVLHLYRCALNKWVHLEVHYVPSRFNLADKPSRQAHTREITYSQLCQLMANL